MRILRLLSLSASLIGLATVSALHAAVNINSVPTPDAFPAVPAITDWRTRSVGSASDPAITTAAQFDAKVIAASNFSTITADLFSSATIPPSTNGIARWNTGANTVPPGITFLQTRPAGNDYLLLLAQLSNATSGPLSSVRVAYDYSKATVTASETIKGLRAYWSLTGDPGSWTLIPDLSVDTTGTFDAPEAISGSITLPAPLAPGGTLFLLWADQNSPGTDASYHIDNFSASRSLNCSIAATSSGVVRQPGVSASDPFDDTVSFSATITGTGDLSSAGWRVAAPAAFAGTTGAYGIPRAFANVPVSQFSGGRLQLTFEDATTTACLTLLSVFSPLVIGTNAAENSPIFISGAVPSGWVVEETNRIATYSGLTQADQVIESGVIDVSAAGVLQFTAGLDAIAGASSGFETADSFALELIIDAAAPVSVLGAADADNSGRLTGGPAGSGSELPDAGSTGVTKSLAFSYIIPATASTIQIRVIGNSNSPSETLLVKNITLRNPPATLFATTGPGPATLNNKGTNDPADDEFSGPVTVSGVNLGASTGWSSDEVPPRSGLYSSPNPVIFGPYSVTGGAKTVVLTDNENPAIASSPVVIVPPVPVLTVGVPVNLRRIPHDPGPEDDTVTFDLPITLTNGGPSWTAAGATPATGPAKDSTVTFTVPAGTGVASASVTIADASYPVVSQTVTVEFPGLYVIGQKNFGGGLSDVSSTPVTPPNNAWVNDPDTRTLTMNDGDVIGGAAEKTISSEVIDLSSVSGPVSFSANLHVTDLTSGFEVPDTFLAVLILNGNAAIPVSLIFPYDIDASGLLNGPELCPVPAVNPTVQDFDYQLDFMIPDNVLTAQLVISGLTDSINETMIVGDVLFSAAPGPVDSDSDGISNADESIMGTDPNNPHDVLWIRINAANPALAEFPTKPGRFYRVYSSNDAAAATHLAVWKDSGLATIAGDGNVHQSGAGIAPGVPRRFYRIHVMQTDGPWPPAWP